MKFLVVAPPYRNNSAGVRVLHRLCHLLNETGHAARMHSETVNPEWNTPKATKDEEFDTVIYPEVVEGNPFQAAHVVRYVLNQPGKIGGLTEYGANEMVWAYAEDLVESARKASQGRAVRVMTLPVIERELFKPNGPKDTEAVYIGKGIEGFMANPHYFKGREVITSEWPKTRKEMAALLQRTTTLYSYDPYTMLLYEAYLCGCQVKLITPEGTEDYTPPYDLGDETQMVKDFAQAVADYYAEAA